MTDSNSNGKIWVAVGAIGGLLGGAAAMLVALRPQTPAPASSPSPIAAPAPEANAPATIQPSSPQQARTIEPSVAERPQQTERRAKPAAPRVDESPATPFTGLWRGYYVCGDSFGDGRNSLEFTLENGEPARALETFQRGFLSGTIVYRIENIASDDSAITLSTDNFGGYQLQLTYDSTANTLEGVYVGHASCKTMRLNR